MKKAGWTLIIISAIVIFYNVVLVKSYNDDQVQNHPIATLFSFGSNLKQGYTFEPPYTEFEVFIMALGVIGVVMLLITTDRDKSP